MHTSSLGGTKPGTKSLTSRDCTRDLLFLLLFGGVEGFSGCGADQTATAAFFGVPVSINDPTFRSNPNHPLHMTHAPVDDDDVSQHEYMVADQKNQTSLLEISTDRGTPGKAGGGCGYRRIEDWHDDHVKANPEEHQVLTHLKREKARWGKTFESLGGDGI